jgi:hypothetical protein
MSGVETFGVATTMPSANHPNFRRNNGNDINISDTQAAMGVAEVTGHGNVKLHAGSSDELGVSPGMTGNSSGNSFFNRGQVSYAEVDNQQLDQ